MVFDKFHIQTHSNLYEHPWLEVEVKLQTLWLILMEKYIETWRKSEYNYIIKAGIQRENFITISITPEFQPWWIFLRKKRKFIP